jgi:predicted nucleic acid-binding Zn ribbon protein
VTFDPILLIPSIDSGDGLVGSQEVKVVSSEWMKVLRHSYRVFRAVNLGVPSRERKRLRYLVQLHDAHTKDKPSKLNAVAHSIALLNHVIPEEPRLSEGPAVPKVEVPEQVPEMVVMERIQADPMRFLRDETSRRAGVARLVLWEEHRTGQTKQGVLCENGILGALHVLLMQYLATRTVTSSGKCVVCGTAIVKSRGNRRKTCSDKCRKQASRLQTAQRT